MKIWIIGAYGIVSTTAMVGAKAIEKNLTSKVGLISALPPFKKIDEYIPFSFDFGGHEIRPLTNAYEAACEHWEMNRHFEKELLEAVKGTKMQVLVLWPNIDADSDGVAQAIRRFREINGNYPMHAYKNLEPEAYIPVLAKAACAVGNSSSFIRDASYLGTPVVLVGSRQDGREWCEAVKRVESEKRVILSAIRAQVARGSYAPSDLYGKPGVYGIVSMRKSTRVGINEFIEGYLKAENMRIRAEPLKFLVKPPSEAGVRKVVGFKNLKIKIGDFELEVEGGEIKEREIIGVAGRNALGKTTFVKVLAGLLKPSQGEIKDNVEVSYKPQYLEAPEKLVKELFRAIRVDPEIELNRDILSPLELSPLLNRKASDLSGGELQRVAIGLCLAQKADLYLLDEPSAYLDSEQRVRVAKLIRKLTQRRKRACLVVEHDLMLLDYLSDRMMVFFGEPGKKGIAKGPMEIREAMRLFLKEIGITLRRDPQTKRPRINKLGSKKDKELREKNIWYEEV